nr:hypothetical protein [Paraburkholderia fungorum]
MLTSRTSGLCADDTTAEAEFALGIPIGSSDDPIGDVDPDVF